MRVTRFLAFRLFIIILLIMMAGTALFTTLNVNNQSTQLMERSIMSTFRMSDILKSSMRYSMMLNRREDIYHTTATLGHEPGIEAIRIYNKQGIITFSSDSANIGNNVDLNAEACTACHGGGATPQQTPDPKQLYRIFSSPRGYRVLGMITPIRNETSCSEADCHAHPASQTVLGVLDVMVPLTDVDLALQRSTQTQYAFGFLLVLVVTGAMGIFIWLLVNKPVHQLTFGTEELMKGNLSHRIRVRSNDEIGALATSFNKMTEELQRSHEENERWTKTLEERVAEKTEELRRAQSNLIHVEKMASLGKLAATVAHELNNPLAGVLTYAKLLKKKIAPGTIAPDDLAEIQTELTLIADETARCGSIVKNLLLFSRQKVGEMRSEDLRTIVDRCVKLIDHHMKMHHVQAAIELGEGPLSIHCDPQQIEQALLALAINAIEAMPEGGTLRIASVVPPGSTSVNILVSDTGIGISEADIPHIFEPFFTTKENEKGTGLGLSVVYGIIERHNGTITVDSRKGSGTTFTLALPKEHQAPSENNSLSN